MASRRSRGTLAVVIAIVVSLLPVAAQSGADDRTSASTEAPTGSTAGPLAALGWVAERARDVLADAATALAPRGRNVSLGADGRFTVLLLGSDHRPGYDENLDVILVMSLDPDTGRIAAASIPRDTARFPRATGGTSGDLRVNAMFRAYRSSSCSRACAFSRFRNDVERALGIGIDAWAAVRFSGFDELIDHVGGVRVDTPRIVDRAFQDEPTPPYGIRFPEASDYALRGGEAPNCRSYLASSPPCHRAIVWVRSRKGIEGDHANNDFRRAYRQQRLVMAAIRKVLARGSDDLPALANAIGAHTESDLAPSLANAQRVFELLRGSRLGPTVVFSPSRWAAYQSGMPAYTFALKLSRVRAWIDDRMPPT